MTTSVSLALSDLASQVIFPNEVHIWSVEMFGLTGDRYLYHPALNHMIYEFTDEKDAVMFMLRWGGQIVKLTEPA